MKRVLISGGSGFVGANLTRRALRDGHEVHLLVRPSHNAWRLEEIASDVRVHCGYIEDAANVRALVRQIRPEWVFHLAAFGAYSSQTGIQAMAATNLLGCAALLDASIEAGAEAFVQTGSSSEYGLKGQPAAEFDLLEPNSHYAITKAAATHYCQNAARKEDFNAVTVRLYSIYGSYEEPTRLIPTLILNGLHGKLPPLVSPRTARDFVYVDDAVDAILKVAKASPAPPRGAVYNVSSGKQCSLAEIVAIARQLMAIELEPVWSTMSQRSWDTDVWVGVPEKIQREIGWQATTGLERGLCATIDWFRDNPKWLEFYEGRIVGI